MLALNQSKSCSRGCGCDELILHGDAKLCAKVNCFSEHSPLCNTQVVVTFRSNIILYERKRSGRYSQLSHQTACLSRLILPKNDMNGSDDVPYTNFSNAFVI
mmetsp:Transcript_25986/g.49452  ORF Transcript_25986/g.49452 Transcript_25986/m.49452 type:complete len:102 (-) Transcript_25986:1161-1466(-)